jgi:hypothetical protein
MYVMARVKVSGMVMTGVRVRVREMVNVRVWDDGYGIVWAG